MEKEIHALLKFINVIFCFALLFFLTYYLNQNEVSYKSVSGLYDPVVSTILEVVAGLFILTIIPFCIATFYKVKSSLMIFVGITFVNLFLLFMIYIMLY